ncbi:MAG TPA: SDR family NAD(P)-dependent oxidoreductase [Beijerinckiaceae bacterium]|nr:SDR family NAD(P)-dependent oxidoreductase [Beijerinckiaceae bacterium]
MEYKGLKVLVTGADGFIGSHLTEKLVQRDAKVTALCLYNSFDHHGWLDDLRDETRGKLTLVRGDIRDSAFVRRLAEGQEVIFHLAALIAIPYSYAAAQSYAETNVLGTLNVLEAAREHGALRVVHTSTSEVYGTALTMPINESHPLQGQSPYSASKIGADMMAEAFARSFELPVAILRPFNTFGPRQSERAIIPTIIRQALDPSCNAIQTGDTSPLRDFTFVEDTAEAFLALGIAPNIQYGRPYNAGSGKAVSVKDIIDLVLEATHCQRPVVQDPKRMRPAGSEVRALLADSRRLNEDTGWRPRIDLREGLERTVAWWRERLAMGLVRRETGFMT